VRLSITVDSFPAVMRGVALLLVAVLLAACSRAGGVPA